ncbi:hypothetical protein SAMN04244560_00870 [Thermoanaerobacter thermohydrosulfuricus]|uniref:Uncharacterized protein n=1 Tax=Thermoanaerobacter thermohydrosulfuricus TaxID=1516 RepID=A0A1G7LV14_THETY|nr:hypothetical protein [Thermoanaerobacter thermohydrosulfuricus]SDF52789.1 hypothetical protein SAMN04244560_00870 [Thermoanaerobacter thermohydrosulfuricus]
MKKRINFQKEVWEGWTIEDFIKELEPSLAAIQSGRSWYPPITTKAQLKEWCKENQPYYKKAIPEVVQYFSQKYNLK